MNAFQVAKESVLRFCPSANITAYHDSIMKWVHFWQPCPCMFSYTTDVIIYFPIEMFSVLFAVQTTTWSSLGISSLSWTPWTTEVRNVLWNRHVFPKHCVFNLELTLALLSALSSNKCFSVVFTAARNHVNRMCLAANIPLIESGTAGYLGQVTVIKKARNIC